MRRLGALAVALVLIGAAVALRSYVIAPDDGGGESSGNDGPVIACSSDLGAVCEALASAVGDGATSEVVEPGDVVDGDEDAAWDAWLTSDLWSDIASADPDPDTPWVVGDPVAAGAVSMIATPSTAQTFTTGCPDALDWNCVTRATSGGLEGGQLFVGLGPTDATDALLAAIAVTTAVTRDADIDIVDLETASTATAVRDALEDLAGAETDADHLDLFLARPSRYDAAAGLAAQATLEDAARRDDFEPFAVTPLAEAGLVVVATDDDEGREAAERLTEALGDESVSATLAAGGWDRDPSSLDTSGRPRPAVVARIRAIWNEVNR